MIGVIINPHARGVASDPSLSRRLAKVGGSHTTVVETRDLTQLGAALRAFAEQRVEIVASCGGDGTNVAVLTEMIEVYGKGALPRVAFLRGGTFNTIASNQGVRGSPEGILGRLVACYRRGHPVPTDPRPTLLANGRCGFVFAAALGSRFYEAYYRRSQPGWAWASFLAARAAASSLVGGGFSRWLLDPLRVRIVADGVPLPGDRFGLVLASTVISVGLGIRITYRARERADRFHFIASGVKPFDLARQFHKVFRARPLVGEGHLDLLCAEVTLEFDGDQPLIIDGDFFRADHVVLQLGPRIRLCVP